MTYQLLACWCDFRVHECLCELCWVAAVQYTFSQKYRKPRCGLANHLMKSQIHFYIAFGCKTVCNSHCDIQNAKHTLVLPLLLFNLFKMRHEVMQGFIHSYADSKTSHTFKEQENLNRALGCWKVIIIYLYSALERSGTSCIVMHDFMWGCSLSKWYTL